MRGYKTNVCSHCGAPVYVEHSYGERWYEFTCTHRETAEAKEVDIDVIDWPCGYFESLLQSWRWETWRELWDACIEAGHVIAGHDYATLRHPLDIPYDAEHRRERHAFRHLSASEKFSRILRHTWAPRIQAHVDEHRLLAAALEEESMEAHISLHRDLNRRAFGD